MVVSWIQTHLLVAQVYQEMSSYSDIIANLANQTRLRYEKISGARCIRGLRQVEKAGRRCVTKFLGVSLLPAFRRMRIQSGSFSAYLNLVTSSSAGTCWHFCSYHAIIPVRMGDFFPFFLEYITSHLSHTTHPLSQSTNDHCAISISWPPSIERLRPSGAFIKITLHHLNHNSSSTFAQSVAVI